MSADLSSFMHDQPAPNERVLFLLYQLATWGTLSSLDEVSMMAFASGEHVSLLLLQQGFPYGAEVLPKYHRP